MKSPLGTKLAAPRLRVLDVVVAVGVGVFSGIYIFKPYFEGQMADYPPQQPKSPRDDSQQH